MRILLHCSLLLLVSILQIDSRAAEPSTDDGTLLAFERWAQPILSDFRQADQILDTIKDKASAASSLSD